MSYFPRHLPFSYVTPQVQRYSSPYQYSDPAHPFHEFPDDNLSRLVQAATSAMQARGLPPPPMLPSFASPQITPPPPPPHLLIFNDPRFQHSAKPQILFQTHHRSNKIALKLCQRFKKQLIVRLTYGKMRRLNKSFVAV